MSRNMCLGALLSFLVLRAPGASAAPGAPAGHQSDEEAAVLEAMNRAI